MKDNIKICSNTLFIKIKVSFEIILINYKDILKIKDINNSYKNKNKKYFLNLFSILNSIIIQPCTIMIIKE